MGLSVAMIACNEALRIGPTLAAVEGWADEIIVVDSGSTDATQDICRRLGARVIEQSWLGFGRQKNLAMDECREDWILLIDADEIVTPKLRDEIDAVMVDPGAADVYAVPFDHVVYGRVVRHGGWGGEERVRLFRPGTGRWSEVEVHEIFETERPIGSLKNRIEHRTYLDRAHYRRKVDQYTTLEASMGMRRGERPRFFYSAARAAYRFFRMYVWGQGYLDGLVGLELATYSAYYIYLADRKLARLRAAKKEGSPRRE